MEVTIRRERTIQRQQYEPERFEIVLTRHVRTRQEARQASDLVEDLLDKAVEEWRKREQQHMDEGFKRASRGEP